MGYYKKSTNKKSQRMNRSDSCWKGSFGRGKSASQTNAKAKSSKQETKREMQDWFRSEIRRF